MVMARARKNVPGHSGNGNERQEYHNGGESRAQQGNRELGNGTVDRLHRLLAGVAVKDNVFNHHDGVVDHQPDGGRQAT